MNTESLLTEGMMKDCSILAVEVLLFLSKRKDCASSSDIPSYACTNACTNTQDNTWPERALSMEIMESLRD